MRRSPVDATQYSFRGVLAVAVVSVAPLGLAALASVAPVLAVAAVSVAVAALARRTGRSRVTLPRLRRDPACDCDRAVAC